MKMYVKKIKDMIKELIPSANVEKTCSGYNVILGEKNKRWYTFFFSAEDGGIGMYGEIYDSNDDRFIDVFCEDLSVAYLDEDEYDFDNENEELICKDSIKQIVDYFNAAK